jgi:hypothetical protein
MLKALIRSVVFVIFLAISSTAYSQTYANGQQFDQLGRDTARVINTAVPFMLISPDARSGAMGDVGVALSPDANSTYWNVAKLPFGEKDFGVSVSYTPWLRRLINDMSITYLSAFMKIRKQEAIGFSMTYFDLGTIQFRNANGDPLQEYRPQEYAFKGYYSRKLSEKFGLGIALGYIHSNLTGSAAIDNQGTTGKSANAFCVSMNFFYKSNDFLLSGYRSNFTLGGGFYNIGNKVSYTNNDQRDWIPTQLKIGGAMTTHVDEYNKFTLALDFNKLMVPSPPVMIYANTDSAQIVRGKDPNRPLLNGMVSSFWDAPDGFKEELREWQISVGGEYWYNNVFAVRGGYFYESKYKGNRKYFTLGLGVKYQTFGLDFAYLVPLKQNNPLAETLRFTLQFNFKSKKVIEDIRSN